MLQVEKSFMSGENKDNNMSSPSGPPVSFQEMHNANYSSLEKMKRKAKENPSVPIGKLFSPGCKFAIDHIAIVIKNLWKELRGRSLFREPGG